MCHHDWFLKALFKENAHCKMTGAPYYLHIFKTESYVIYMNTIHNKSVSRRRRRTVVVFEVEKG